MDIQGKIAVITGASSGIGAATAKKLAKKGALVILLARDQEGLNQVVKDILAEGGKACCYSIDLSQVSNISKLAENILANQGVPDIIVNNAGAGRWLSVEETNPEEAVQMMAVPYFAAFSITHAFLSKMRERNSGCIVNMTSVASYYTWPGAAGYISARWALRGFNNALRAELHNTNINVLLIAAGKVGSAYFKNNPGSEERIPKIANLFPTLTPDNVADAIVKGIEKNRREIIIPWGQNVTAIFHRMFPWVMEWLLLKTSSKK